ncbi:hypothetical protein CCACVL1_25703 [Corchorus capsularis]|uniref:Uncharacterized protein n=1 Tax=Corchorus capsularis TaxID=210143 RepID=A0A1R3GHW9_COCAP|nr:hypothetical protein CCACVL1_25703 [Corchorus capsularis]
MEISVRFFLSTGLTFGFKAGLVTQSLLLDELIERLVRETLIIPMV